MLPKPAQASVKPISFWRMAALFSLFIGALGLLPHALFSYDVGAWHYMANAWDEDSYTKYALMHTEPMYRLLGSGMLRQLVAWLGLDASLILIDIIPPMLCALLAVAIAAEAGFHRPASRFLAACLLLFALELLGLCNVTMTGSWLSGVLPFSSFDYPEWVRMWVPNLFEIFFNLYKSPEPQISFVVQFTALLLLLRHAHSQQLRYVWALLLLSLSYPFIYITTGITLLMAMGIYSALGWLVTRARHHAWLLIATIIAAAMYGYVIFAQPPTTGAAIFLFYSRLPAFSLSILWAGVALWLAYRRWGAQLRVGEARRQLGGDFFLVLACCLVPFITLNQQVITGIMVQSRSWDNYSNLPFVALALLMVWPRRYPLRRWLLPAGAVLLALWLIVAQLRMTEHYRPASLDNIATARMLATLRAQSSAALPAIILESVGDDSQVALRLGAPWIMPLAGYQQTLAHRAAPLSVGDAAHDASIAPIAEQAFTYFDRKGLTPEALEAAMVEEANRAQAGPHIMYFFSLMDSWRPLSDYRRENVAGMRAKIPSIIADYRAFLSNPARRMQFGEILYASPLKRPLRADVPWQETLVEEMTLGSAKPVTVYLYRQAPR